MRTTLNLPDSLVDILYAVENIKIEISWDEIIRMQTENLKNGINKVGISDLIIVQNTIQNNISLFTLGKHFFLMKKLYRLNLFLGN